MSPENDTIALKIVDQRFNLDLTENLRLPARELNPPPMLYSTDDYVRSVRRAVRYIIN